jgi:SAM-dependent methyltransferase
MEEKKVVIDPVWDKIHGSGWGKYPAESVVRFLVRYKRAAPDFANSNTLLELGCGGGANTKMIIAEGYRVTAIDGSPNAIKNTKNYVGEGATLQVLDFNALSEHFAPESFDIIVDNVSIYTAKLEDIKNILAQVHTILKKGGLFYSSVFSPFTSGYLTGDEVEPGTYTDIKEGALANAGLQHISTEEEMREVYGNFFSVRSIDTHEYTELNKERRVGLLESVWVK